PLQGTGDHSYYLPGYGYLEANFGETYYDWTAMKDNVTGGSSSHTIYAVAELQYHAAIAVNMSFGPNGSGAMSGTVPYAMKTYFNYSSATSIVSRSSYTQQTWDALLMNNIDNGRPMYYSGNDGATGHAFVCDGYQDGSVNYFHFNFGWSGYGDGFYTASNAGGFPYDQRVIKNIYPDDVSYQYPYYCNGPSVINTIAGSIDDGSGPYSEYENNASCSWLLAPDQDSVNYFTLNFVKFDTENSDILTIYDGETTSDPVLGSFSGNTIPGNLVSTGDKVLITFETDGSGTAQGWRLEYSSSQPSFCTTMTTLTEPSGTFSDGSGDWKYKKGTFCRWTINVPTANSISLEFPFFDTEMENDYIRILDYSTSPPTELGEFSGSFPPPTITGVGPITIIFMTNEIINKQGWTIYYEIDNVGTEEIEMVSYFNMFPNPANDLLNVEFILPETQKIELSILNLTGSVIYSEALGQVEGRNTLSIDVSDLTPGVYLLRLVGDQGILNKRVIVR
ncbi:MAG: C10 family peptidase, partial [Bacteroidales bacterium]|nr:C10 family peptidase [Bacteroidales bacterium]